MPKPPGQVTKKKPSKTALIFVAVAIIAIGGRLLRAVTHHYRHVPRHPGHHRRYSDVIRPASRY